MRKILLASDHAGYQQKCFLLDKLKNNGYEAEDLGCYSLESVNYPEYAFLVAKAIHEGKAEFGVLVCGSGEGMVMAANRVSGVRAGLAWNCEVAALLRQHNNAQIICFGARFTADAYAWMMLQSFLHAEFEDGKHGIRVAMIDQAG